MLRKIKIIITLLSMWRQGYMTPSISNGRLMWTITPLGRQHLADHDGQSN